MNKLRTSALVLLVIISIMVSLSIQLLISVQTTLLNPNYYTNLMQKHDMYDLPQNYILLSIKNNYTDLPEPICVALSPSINTAFSDDWAKYQGDKLVNNIISYLKTDEDTLLLEVPLKDRKVILKEEITNYLAAKYTPEELAAFKITSPEKAADKVVSSINIPDTINASKVLNLDAHTNKSIDIFRTYYKTFSLLPYILFFISILMFILIGKNGLGIKLAGYSIVAAGFITILFTSASLVFLDGFIVSNIAKQNDLLMSIGTNPVIIASIIKNSVMNTLNKIALIFCLIGIITIISSGLKQKYFSKTTPSDLVS